MSKIETVTAETFDRVLSEAFEGLKSVRDRVQAVICFAVAHYVGDGTPENSGNGLFLTKILRKAIDTRGLNARGIQAYIQAAANVEWRKDKVGDLVFAKVKADRGKPATCDAAVLAKPWYEWVADNMGSNNAKADWNLSKYLNQVVHVLEKQKIPLSVFESQLKKRYDALQVDDAA